MKQLHHHSLLTQDVLDKGEIVLSAGRIPNMGCCEIGYAIANCGLTTAAADSIQEKCGGLCLLFE